MADKDALRSTPADGNPALPGEPEAGYLTRTGEAVAEDGSVAPIIGGLPAVEGSAWDIGAPLDDRGTDFADEPETRPER